MGTYTLTRDGQRPLRFEGDLLAESDGHMSDDAKEQNRFYVLRLYQQDNRRYVVSIAYTSTWQGELSHSRAETCQTMDEAIAILEDFDPCAWVEGFKHLVARNVGTDAATAYARRQEILERSIRERYQAQVSALCTALDYAEEA